MSILLGALDVLDRIRSRGNARRRPARPGSAARPLRGRPYRLEQLEDRRLLSISGSIDDEPQALWAVEDAVAVAADAQADPYLGTMGDRVVEELPNPAVPLDGEPGPEAIPDLQPYTPSGWSDSIVISTVTGTNTDNSPIYTTDNVYMDFAWANYGDDTAGPYWVDIYLDGSYQFSYQPTTAGWTYNYDEDQDFGTLSAGSHTVTMYVDYDDEVVESNETNNDYSRAFDVEALTDVGHSPLRTQITLSIGLAAYPEHARSASELVDAADRALAAAKQAGRNRVVIWEAEPAETPA